MVKRPKLLHNNRLRQSTLDWQCVERAAMFNPMMAGGMMPAPMMAGGMFMSPMQRKPYMQQWGMLSHVQGYPMQPQQPMWGPCMAGAMFQMQGSEC